MAHRAPLDDILKRDPTGKPRERPRPVLTILLVLAALLVVAVLVVEVMQFRQEGPMLSRPNAAAGTRTAP